MRFPELQGFSPLNAGGFNAYVGDLLIDPAAGPEDAARFAFAPEAKHLNGGGALHGGLLMTLADNVLGTVAHSRLAGKVASTVTLNVDFLAGGDLSAPVRGGAQITRVTRSLLFVSGALTQGDRMLVTATGIWKVIGA